MSFKDAFQRIQDGIGDLTELNVRTFTGDMSVDANNVKNVKLDTLLGSQAADVKIKVVGITNMKIDGDVDQFITSAEVPTMTITAHTTALETGQRTRQAVFDLFLDKARDAIAKI